MAPGQLQCLCDIHQVVARCLRSFNFLEFDCNQSSSEQQPEHFGLVCSLVQFGCTHWREIDCQSIPFRAVNGNMQVDLKQFEGMAVQHARKNKEQEEDDLDLKNRRAPKTQKEKALKEVKPPDKFNP